MKKWLIFVWKDGPSFAMWLMVFGLVIGMVFAVIKLLGDT